MHNILFAVKGNTLLWALMGVLVVFLVLLVVLGIVFIVALRRRAPVVKVIMAPPREEPTVAFTPAVAAGESAVPASPAPVAEEEPELAPEEDDVAAESEDDTVFVTEGQEKVRYDRSFEAKLIQLKDETKEWYTTVKNELLSYKKVRSRISWRRESFQMGRMKVARFVVRGKTLCLLLAVEPSGYAGTKFAVEDVSNVSSSADTPTMYRIKSSRRAKYAVEMIAGIMKELSVTKQPDFVEKDYFMPYEGTMSLIRKGLVKRVVSSTTRTFEIREVDRADVPDEEYTVSDEEIAEAAAAVAAANGEQVQSEQPAQGTPRESSSEAAKGEKTSAKRKKAPAQPESEAAASVNE